MAQDGFRVIGDAIHFDGYVAARIRSDLPATVRDDLEHYLSNAYGEEPETEDEKTRKNDVFVKGVDAMLRSAKDHTEAGFVELAQLESTATTLKTTGYVE